MMQPSQTMTTYSLVTAEKLNSSIPTSSTPNHNSQHISTTASSRLDFNTLKKLPPVSK